MTDDERKQLRKEWLATRPECIQKLAAEFPEGHRLGMSGESFFIIGWNEDDTLIVSPINPAIDYGGAVKSKRYVHARHFRAAVDYSRPPVTSRNAAQQGDLI